MPDAPFGREIQIAWDLLTILSDPHDLHIAHLDIKPTNVLWDSSSQSIRVIDFDSAVRLDPNGGRKVGGIVGTSGFVAPEVESEEVLEYDPFLADAFSCGQVLWLWRTVMAERMSEERRFVPSLARELRKEDINERWSISKTKEAWIAWLKKRGDNYQNSVQADRGMADSGLLSNTLPASAACMH